MKMCVVYWSLLVILCSAGSFQLTRKDVRPAMGEMLKYHVEYKEFSPTLARRSIKLYMDNFDAEKIYLLASEAVPFLELKDKQLQAVVSEYSKDSFTLFESLHQVIQNAIIRARALREESFRELVLSTDDVAGLPETHLDYAKSETELKSRIKNHFAYLLMKERQQSNIRTWEAEQKQKAFALWERRYNRIEDTYLVPAGAGKKSAKEMSDHYLSMHILKALARSLDAHTSYYSPEEAIEMRMSLEKQFEGIGVVLREGIEGVIIMDLIKGGPAARSGSILTGDQIVEIDGSSVVGNTYEEVLRKLQGKGSGAIRLGLKRSTVGKELYLHVDLMREKIIMQEERLQYSVEPFASGVIAKLSLPSFYESGDASSCERDIREALRTLKQQGNIQGIVLDMRENSGGFLNQAVKVASLFLSSGVVVISKYAHNEIHYLRNLDIRSFYNGPLLILASRASASAAEIVAQALQDYGIALVVGDERTYGKGTIQYQTVTDQEALSFFKVTVGRYYTVSGRSTQIDGVLADIITPTIYSALNIGERYLEFPLKADRVPSAYNDPLTDIDQRNRMWFQRNYLPNIQKKLSTWTQMLTRLKDNSEKRLAANKDYLLFLKTLDEVKAGQNKRLSRGKNWGTEDLQMAEAVAILKDMILIKQSSVQQTLSQ